ncbi:MAG: DUF2946 family protein [Rhodocyclales bacterium]|nr:DUF2946 family protein [Rhodocyclales bacterium]
MSGELAPQVKWPNVPACYGWLSLDRRGNWRLKGGVVRHPGLVSYLNNHYAPDAAGNWLVSNGPQAVYARLDYTPLIWRLAAGKLFAHAGQIDAIPQFAYIDEDGNILFACAEGIGLLHDLDLPDFAGELRNRGGQPAVEDELAAAAEGLAELNWRGLPLVPILSRDVAGRFGFNPDPCP